MFENALREIRQEKQLSQLELGRLTRISPSTICMLENGRQYPFPGWRKRLAEVLKVQENVIFPN